MKRRRFLAHCMAATPFTSLLLGGCRDDGDWPEGMTPIKWDRDACARCKMVISDPRFAVQIRGGPTNATYKFDDIGCAATWRAEKTSTLPWIPDASTRFWVADYGSKGKTWLPALTAHYQPGRTSPMGYNYAAFATPQADTVDFDAMSKQTSNAWPTACQTDT